MSLWFHLNMNDKTIATVAITRTTNTETGTLPDDTVSTYEVQLDGQPVGTVEHRYGNGAFDLAHKATTLIDAWMANHNLDPFSITSTRSARRCHR